MSSADTADARRPIRRALVSVYDKSGLPDLADALNAAGVAIVSTGSTAKTIAAQGVPVTSVEDLTGFPECLDGRVKTLHPRVHAGILADTRQPRPSATARGPRRRAVRPRRLQPLPLPRHRGLGRVPAGVHRADRHRRPVDGPRGRQEPRERRHRHQPRRVPPAREGARRRGLHPRRAAASGRRGVRPHGDLRHRRRQLDGHRRRRHDRRDRVPGVDRCDLGPRSRAALRREPAPAGGPLPSLAPRHRARRAAARQGDVLQQLRRRRRRGPRGPRPR